jgi:hypothetical protein
VSQVTDDAKVMRSEGLQCGEPLTRGRSCVHARGHEGHHSHSWEPYNYRVREISGRYVDTVTGEIVCELTDAEDFASRARSERPSESEAAKILGSISSFRGKPVLKPLPADYHGREDYWCPHTAADMMACARCNYGFENADGSKPPVAPPAVNVDVEWHYRGKLVWMGRDAEGHDYEKDARTGNVTRVYSANDKRDAVALAAEHGVTAAARKTGIPWSTLKNWVARV